MHIPVKVDYGVRALVDLAMHRAAAPVRASEIAGRTMIPEPYLAQVLHTLGRAGLVRSQRGRLGGHSLAIEPDDISLSFVMDCLGPNDNLVPCLEDMNACIHVPVCAQREVWHEVELAVDRVLSSRTIADLVARSYAIQAEATTRKIELSSSRN